MITRRLAFLVVLLMGLAACQGPVTPAIPPAPTTTPEIFIPLPADQRAFEAARSFLAARLGVDPLAISLVQVSPVDWPDSCLGLAAAGEACAQMVTPGFRIQVETGGKSYELHTNQAATEIRLAP